MADRSTDPQGQRPYSALASAGAAEHVKTLAAALAGQAAALDAALAREREQHLNDLENHRLAFERILEAAQQNPPDLSLVKGYAREREEALRNHIRYLTGVSD